MAPPTLAETEDVEAEQIKKGNTVLHDGWPVKVNRITYGDTVVMETRKVVLRYWRRNQVTRVVKV